MNKFTLEFLNQQLETRYQSYANTIQLDIILQFLQYNQLSLFMVLMAFLFTDEYYGLLVTILSCIGNLTYFFLLRCIRSVKLLAVYEFFNLLAPEIVILLIYICDKIPVISTNMQVWIILSQMSMIHSQKTILAFITILNNFVIFYVINYLVYGFNIFNFIWIPYIMVCCTAYYTQQKDRRLLFASSQVNDSIYEIMKNTSNEQFMLFRYEEDQVAFKLELTNIENFSLSEYLKSISISSNQTLSQYIYKHHMLPRMDQSIYKTLITGVNYCQATGRKQKVNMELYIQSYPKLKFYLRIMEVKQHDKKIQTENRRLQRNLYSIQITYSQLNQSNFQCQIYLLHQKMFRKNLQMILNYPNKFMNKVENINFTTILDNIQWLLKLRLEVQGSQECCSHRIIIQALLISILLMIKKHSRNIRVMIDGKSSMIQINLSFEINFGSLHSPQNRRFISKLNRLHELVGLGNLIIKRNNITCFLMKQLEEGFYFDQYQ